MMKKKGETNEEYLKKFEVPDRSKILYVLVLTCSTIGSYKILSRMTLACQWELVMSNCMSSALAFSVFM